MRSFDAVKLVLDHAPKDLTPIQRLVLIQIAHRQPNCIASVPTLAAEIGVKQPKTVTKATRQLADLGLITVSRRYANSNSYVLNDRAFDAFKALNIPMFDAKLKGGLTPLTRHATPVKQTYNKQDIYIYPFKIDFEFDLTPNSVFWQRLLETREGLGLDVGVVRGLLERFQQHPNCTMARDGVTRSKRFFNTWLLNASRGVEGIPQKPEQGYSVAEGDE